MNSLKMCQECQASRGVFFLSVMSYHIGFLLTCCFVLRQYQDFLEDLEEDEALRKNVNIYRGEQLDTADFLLMYLLHVSVVATEIVRLRLIYCQWLLKLLIDLGGHSLL